MNRGNYYEVTRQVSDKLSRTPVEENLLWVFTFMLDSESIHVEGQVNHILDMIGTIGGAFELIHYTIFIVYFSLRNNLYFHTILSKIHDFKNSQDNLNVKVYTIKDKTLRTVQQEAKSSEESWKYEDPKQLLVSGIQNQIKSFKTDPLFEEYLIRTKNRSLLRK